MQRLSLLATLILLASLLSSCPALLVGAGAGYIVSREVLPNDVHSAQVKLEVDPVWSAAQERMEILQDLEAGDIEVQDYPRVIHGVVGGSKVTVEVEVHDIDRTLIRVEARTRFGGNDSKTAEEVLTLILDQLAE
jgi:hypothetical protein